MFLIGTDEAGYGPNLGPLVISATLWEAPDDLDDDRLYKLVRRCVCRTPAEATARRVAWGDSKDLYQAGAGIGALERGMLAALALIGHRPREWRELWHALDPLAAAGLDAVPWHTGYSADLPLDCDAAELEKIAECLTAGLAKAGVRLLGIASRAIFPAQFNELLAQHENKAAVLSRVTLQLVATMLDRCGPAPARVICDKHGGRNRYGALLQQQFPEWLVEVRCESALVSSYAWGPEDRRVEIRFREKCEEYLPVALASMASKYLREAAMLAFNDFWTRQIPELRPTAGYPGDSRRFKAAIEPLQAQLGIADHALWRPR